MMTHVTSMEGRSQRLSALLTCSGRTVPKKHTTFGCLRAASPAASCSMSSTAAWEAASGAPDRKTEELRHVTTTSLLFHVPMNSCELANPVSLAAMTNGKESHTGQRIRPQSYSHQQRGTLLFQALDWERSK